MKKNVRAKNDSKNAPKTLSLEEMKQSQAGGCILGKSLLDAVEFVNMGEGENINWSEVCLG